MPRAATTSNLMPSPTAPSGHLDYLGPRERPVGDVAWRWPRATVGLQALRVLRDVGLVKVRRDGRQVFYRTNADGIRPLHEWAGRFERYWLNQLTRVKKRAERS